MTKKKKSKFVYTLGDCAPHELHIEKEEPDEWNEPDGQFTFATHKEAQEYALETIDYEINQLKQTRAEIVKSKP